LESREDNTWKKIKLALLREGSKLRNGERGTRFTYCISKYSSLFGMTNSCFARAIIKNVPHNALKISSITKQSHVTDITAHLNLHELML
jgi:hypothetical protein